MSGPYGPEADLVCIRLQDRAEAAEQALENANNLIGALKAAMDKISRRNADLEVEVAQLTQMFKHPTCNDCGVTLGDNWCADCAGKSYKVQTESFRRELVKLRAVAEAAGEWVRKQRDPASTTLLDVAACAYLEGGAIVGWQERAERAERDQAFLSDLAIACREAPGLPCFCGMHSSHVEEPPKDWTPAKGVVERIAKLKDRATVADIYEADQKAAAGECLVPCPEPGSDMSKLLIANRLMKHKIDAMNGIPYERLMNAYILARRALQAVEDMAGSHTTAVVPEEQQHPAGFDAIYRTAKNWKDRGDKSLILCPGDMP